MDVCYQVLGKGYIYLNIDQRIIKDTGIESNLALASGAKIFEKHFTINKNDIGPDHKASCNIPEFKYYIKKIRETELIMGSKKKICVNEEIDMKNVSRKSIFAAKNLKIGEKITEKNINTRRPGKFIPADKFFKIIGKKTKNKINKNQPIKFKDLK